MTEWRLPAAIDAIVTALQAAGAPALDGPVVTDDYPAAVVFVGYDGSPGEEEHASSTQQEWAGIGQRKRDEEDVITCSVVVLYGDGDSWKAARDLVALQLETVGRVLRDDTLLGPSLGLLPPSVAQLWPGEYFQEPGPVGYQARLVFEINYKTRV